VDVDAAHPFELAEGHAHGVGTDRSIHPEDVLADLPVLGAMRFIPFS
jgi:hypothetical protein